jgi:hypothetical protein
VATRPTFYARKVIWACRRNKARFSITARMDAKIRAACQSIPEGGWVDITRLINVAARLAHHARTIHLHLPEHWPWQHA